MNKKVSTQRYFFAHQTTVRNDHLHVTAASKLLLRPGGAANAVLRRSNRNIGHKLCAESKKITDFYCGDLHIQLQMESLLQ